MGKDIQVMVCDNAQMNIFFPLNMDYLNHCCCKMMYGVNLGSIPFSSLSAVPKVRCHGYYQDFGGFLQFFNFY